MTKKKIVDRYIENVTGDMMYTPKEQAARAILAYTVECLISDDEKDRNSMIRVIEKRAKGK